MKKIITNITFGYSDSEDRLWIRLQLDDKKETQLWLTRRLTQALSNGLANMLEKHTDLPDTEDYLRKEFFEASIATFDPTPEPPSTEIQKESKINTGLCHTIHIDMGPIWSLRFEGPKAKEYQLNLDRAAVMKVFIALLKQAELAQWNLQLTNCWLKKK